MKPSKITRDLLLEEVARHHLTYLGYAFTILRDWALAEDLLQETYVVVAEKWESYQPTLPPFFWARGILRNKCNDYIRSKREFTYESDQLNMLLDSSLEHFNGKALANTREQMRVLRKCMGGLKQRSQKLLYDYYVKRQSCKDIAKAAGQQYRTPVTQLKRLRIQLRKCVRQSAEDSVSSFGSEANEETFDDLFSDDLSSEKINTINSYLRSAEMAPQFVHYVQEWCMFAYTLRAIMDQVEGADVTRAIEANVFPARLSDAKFSIGDNGNSMDLVSMPVSKQDEPVSNTVRFPKLKPWMSFAACACICFGLWFIYNKYASVTWEPIALITEGVGTVRGADFGTDKSEVQTGSMLHYGDVLWIPANSSCKLKFLHEVTSFTLTANTEIAFPMHARDGGKRFFLKAGQLDAEIDRQSEDAPMVFATPHSTIVVLGTRFRLRVMPTETRLDLFEGRVLFSGSDDKEEKLIAAGEYGVVESGVVEVGELEDFGNGTNLLPASLHNGLIGYYPFDDGEGDQVSDVSSFHAHGVVQPGLNPEECWVQGKFGSAFSFPFSNREGKKVIEVEGFSHSRIDDRFSMSFWVNAEFKGSDRLLSTKQVPLIRHSFDNKNMSTGWNLVTRMRANAADGYTVGIKIGGAGRGVETKSFLWNEWHHVAVTFDSGLLSIYWNGKLELEHQFSIEKIVWPEDKWLKFSSVTKEPYVVVLDEVLLFERAIDLAEIQMLSRLQ